MVGRLLHSFLLIHDASQIDAFVQGRNVICRSRCGTLMMSRYRFRDARQCFYSSEVAVVGQRSYPTKLMWRSPDRESIWRSIWRCAVGCGVTSEKLATPCICGGARRFSVVRKVAATLLIDAESALESRGASRLPVIHLIGSGSRKIFPLRHRQPISVVEVVVG
jgi:hypothetical protein